MNVTKNDVKRKLNNLEESPEMWKVKFIKEVIDCKEEFLYCSFNNTELKIMLDCLCMDQF